MGPPRRGPKLGMEPRLEDLEELIVLQEDRITHLEDRLTRFIEVHNGNVDAYGKYFDAYEDRLELVEMGYQVLAREVFTTGI